jgi:HTH-type transcriptional regulator, sugar sensing transcriptional regulator
MLSELIQLGLTSGEARIYLSLLKLGSSKVGSIVKDSRVSYSKVYDVLERLITKGLVSYVTFDIISKYWQVIIVIKIVRSILYGA